MTLCVLSGPVVVVVTVVVVVVVVVIIVVGMVQSPAGIMTACALKVSFTEHVEFMAATGYNTKSPVHSILHSCPNKGEFVCTNGLSGVSRHLKTASAPKDEVSQDIRVQLAGGKVSPL